MKIKFEIRTTKKVKEGEMVPLYVRMVDGRAFHQAVKTRTLVNPNMWDEKSECIKSRVLCTPEERERIDKDVNDLRSYLLETYNEAKKKGKTDTLIGWQRMLISSILRLGIPSQRSYLSRSRLMSCMIGFFPSANWVKLANAIMRFFAG